MIVMLDTGYLITLADENRPHHGVALQYLKALVKAECRILISPIVVSEYTVKSSPQLLFEMGCFEFPEYNISHALEASKLKRSTMSSDFRSADNKRTVIINDTQIIAQASVEKVTHILTEDINTFCTTVNRLNDLELTNIKAVPLTDGYQPDVFGLLQQAALPLPE